VHELVHAFGFPHKCGYFTWRPARQDSEGQDAFESCCMNYALNWHYTLATQFTTRVLDRKTTPISADLCALHIDGLRKLHLEDNQYLKKK
jgi:hypothetical protein